MALVPEYVSHSAWSQYIKCGKQYELERVAKVPHPPAWYLVGGSAVHKATEVYDRDLAGVPDSGLGGLWADAYAREIEAAFQRWPEESEWTTAGRPRADGSVQGYEYWDDRGLAALKAWVEWRRLMPHMEPVEIEWEFTLPIGGHVFHGFIDRVFYNRKSGKTDVVDIKTGSKRPDNAHQLGIYKVAWEHSPDSQVHEPIGECGWWMAKDGAIHNEDMAPYSAKVLDALAAQYLRGVQADVFLPNVAGHCFGCTVAEACAMVNPRNRAAHVYDSLLAETED